MLCRCLCMHNLASCHNVNGILEVDGILSRMFLLVQNGHLQSSSTSETVKRKCSYILFADKLLAIELQQVVILMLLLLTGYHNHSSGIFRRRAIPLLGSFSTIPNLNARLVVHVSRVLSWGPLEILWNYFSCFYNCAGGFCG